MFAIKGLAYSRIADVVLGHLILCDYAHGPELALRVETAGDDSADRPGVLYLRCATHWNEIGAVVYEAAGQTSCLDLGVPTFVINSDFISTGISKRSYDPSVGMLGLHGEDLLILAAHGKHAMSRAWWNVASGKQVDVEGRLLIDRWCLGLTDIEKKFFPQLKYPDDFKRNERA